MRTLRGFSLLELVLTLALGGVVLAAGGRLLLALRQFLRAEREALAARQTVRVAAAVLATELRQTSPAAGDLLRISDTAVTLRALRGFYVVCAPATPGGAALVVQDDPALAPGSPVPGRDSLVVWLAGDAPATDRWLHAALGATGGGTCSDGASGRRFEVAPAAADVAAFDRVAVGAPLRRFEVLTYRLYDDGAGAWWLGVRSWQGASWAATSPVAGPLLPREGLTLAFLNAAGAPAAADTAVRSIRITVRAQGGLAPAAGRSQARHDDSLTVVVAPRNE